MKVAILGNMNNNGFSLLRHLRTLGVDAHLFLFSSDGKGELAHFTPENDTWSYADWKRFIHRTRIPDSSFSGLSPALRVILWPLLRITQVCLGRRGDTWFSRRDLRRVFDNFDAIIGSGIAPALTVSYRLRPLDIFFPYSIGIEHWNSAVTNASFLSRSSMPLVKWLSRDIIQNQSEGVRRATVVIASDSEISRASLKKVDKAPKNLIVPIVFRETRPKSCGPSPVVQAFENWRQNFDALLLMPTRQEWAGKRNQLALEAFVALRTELDANVGFALIDHGPDAEAAKEFLFDHGQIENVRWFAQTSRRELGEMLQISTIVLGEFHLEPRVMLGGIGWEALGAGTPIINGFNFTEEEFHSLTGLPIPPIISANSSPEIARWISFLLTNSNALEETQVKSEDWFERYFSEKLPKAWLKEIEKITQP